MSEAARMWTEVVFNVAYLIVVWTLVVLMYRRRESVRPEDRPVAKRFMAAFALLALGDTGHVGFRVVAYARGGLDQTLPFLGADLSLVGLGALATAITVTLFYALMLDVWRLRFHQPLGAFGVFLLIAAAVRLLLMIPAANEWYLVVPPQPWSLYRNLPLTVLGLGVAYLILRDATRAHDRAFVWIGVMILISYACYIPVILLVQQAPLVGMLMIPKTMAYLGIAFIGYRALWAPIPQPVAATA